MESVDLLPSALPSPSLARLADFLSLLSEVSVEDRMRPLEALCEGSCDADGAAGDGSRDGRFSLLSDEGVVAEFPSHDRFANAAVSELETALGLSGKSWGSRRLGEV